MVVIHGESQQAHALPCPIHHVEKRTCHREGHHDGKDPRNEGQTKPMKVQELHLGSGGPQLGPRGPYLKAYLWG